MEECKSFINELVFDLEKRFLTSNLDFINSSKVTGSSAFHDIIKKYKPEPIEYHNIDDLKEDIKTLLVRYSDGICIEKLSSYYFHLFGKHLKPLNYGCKNIIDLLSLLNDTICVKVEGDSHIIMLTDMNVSCAKESKLPHTIIKSFKHILKIFGGAVSIDQLITEYESQTGEKLIFEALGFNSIFELLCNMPSEFNIIKSEESQYFLCNQNMKELPPSIRLKPSATRDTDLSKKKRDFSILLRRNLSDILRNYYPEGLTLEELYGVYKGFFGADSEEFNPSTYKCDSIESLIETLDFLGLERSANKVIVYLKLVLKDKPLKLPLPSSPSNMVPLTSNYSAIDFKTIKEEQYMEVVVGDVYNLNKFWVIRRHRDCSHALDELMDRLNEFYKSDIAERYKFQKASPLMYQNSPLVSLYDEDNLFYRAALVAVEDLEMAKLFYVDYGTIVHVPLSSLYYLHEKFFDLPAQAMKSSLYGATLPTELPSWPKALTHRFIDLVRDKPFQAYIHEIVCKNVKKLIMTLVDITDSEDININQKLLSEMDITPSLPPPRMDNGIQRTETPIHEPEKEQLNCDNQLQAAPPSKPSSSCSSPDFLSNFTDSLPVFHVSEIRNSEYPLSSPLNHKSAEIKFQREQYRHPLRRPFSLRTNLQGDENISSKSSQGSPSQLNPNSASNERGSLSDSPEQSSSNSNMTWFSVDSLASNGLARVTQGNCPNANIPSQSIPSIMPNSLSENPLSELRTDMKAVSKCNRTLFNEDVSSKIPEKEKALRNPNYNVVAPCSDNASIPTSANNDLLPTNCNNTKGDFRPTSQVQPVSSKTNSILTKVTLTNGVVLHVIFFDNILYLPMLELNLVVTDGFFVLNKLIENFLIQQQIINIKWAEPKHWQIFLSLIKEKVPYLDASNYSNLPQLNLIPLTALSEFATSEIRSNQPLLAELLNNFQLTSPSGSAVTLERNTTPTVDSHTPGHSTFSPKTLEDGEKLLKRTASERLPKEPCNKFHKATNEDTALQEQELLMRLARLDESTVRPNITPDSSKQGELLLENSHQPPSGSKISDCSNSWANGTDFLTRFSYFVVPFETKLKSCNDAESERMLNVLSNFSSHFKKFISLKIQTDSDFDLNQPDSNISSIQIKKEESTSKMKNCDSFGSTIEGNIENTTNNIKLSDHEGSNDVKLTSGMKCAKDIKRDVFMSECANVEYSISSNKNDVLTPSCLPFLASKNGTPSDAVTSVVTPMNTPYTGSISLHSSSSTSTNSVTSQAVSPSVSSLVSCSVTSQSTLLGASSLASNRNDSITSQAGVPSVVSTASWRSHPVTSQVDVARAPSNSSNNSHPRSNLSVVSPPLVWVNRSVTSPANDFPSQPSLSAPPGFESSLSPLPGPTLDSSFLNTPFAMNQFPPGFQPFSPQSTYYYPYNYNLYFNRF